MPRVSNKKKSFFKNVKLYKLADTYSPNTQTLRRLRQKDHECKISLDFLATSCLTVPPITQTPPPRKHSEGTCAANSDE